ncbi:MAG: hypothetical protein NZ558_06805 [Blastocatellia bacterium]|nr:hypothetical protein [Blastocatellia bacterium]
MKFVILRQKGLTRCEVCHKSDQLDPVSGICLRCKQIPHEQLEMAKPIEATVIKPSVVESGLIILASLVCLVISIVSLGIVLGSSLIKLGTRGEETINWFLIKVLILISVFNLSFSLLIRKWCSEECNLYLSYLAVILGKFCSGLGLFTVLIVYLSLYFRYLLWMP